MLQAKKSDKYYFDAVSGLKGYEEYKNGCGFSSVRNAIVDAEKEAWVLKNIPNLLYIVYTYWSKKKNRVADAVKDIPGANAGIGVFDDILQGRGIKEIASDGFEWIIFSKLKIWDHFSLKVPF